MSSTEPKYGGGIGEGENRLVGGMADLAIGGSCNGQGAGIGDGNGNQEMDLQNMILPAGRTRPLDLNDKTGKDGTPIMCMTNYIGVNTRKNFKIYQYHVSYQPNIDSKIIRIQLVRERSDMFGDNPVFDGMILYQGQALPEEPLVYSGAHPQTKEQIKVTIKLTKELPWYDPQCLTILNLCNRRVFEMAGYIQLGRNFYNPRNVAAIERHNIEIWPGFVSAIRVHERQLLMVAEMSHKVLRLDTVFDFMKAEFSRDRERFQENCMQALVGCSVLTRYNNKTYRIDDIMWNMSPKATFDLEDGRTISFADYYYQNYDKKITDLSQPLLMSRGKRRASSDTSDRQDIYLVPELCAMTGLTDALRENRSVMQDLAKFTRVDPPVRIDRLRGYLSTMNNNTAATSLFRQWGITLDEDVLKVRARELPGEEIIFGTRKVRYNRRDSDWSKECRTIILDDPRPLNKWLIVFAPSAKSAAEEFYKQVQVLGRGCGMAVTEPITCQTNDETVYQFLEAIKRVHSSNQDLQIVVIMVPNDNKTRYDAIKKACCLELGLPSQVVKARSLDKNTVSVASKILLQMNCKMGGSLWRVNIPLKNSMIIGYDLYNDSSSRNRKVGAAVFSTDERFSKWYSQCQFHGQESELVANLTEFCINGLKKYEKVNGQLPDRIILFRDGCGDGHIPVVVTDELPKIRKAFLSVGGESYKPRFAFVIVTKRVHSRYFKVENGQAVNPIPGTVVDDVITRPERYDFYLVPQCVRQGTVTPVSYNVIFDESDLSPANMQKLAYKLCHMYYNWQGTIRVPAPCQFAHKLAFLVGQSLHQQPHELLADKLFFL